MKRMKRHLALLLALTVMLTSFATIGAAAAEPDKPWVVQNLTANSGAKSVTLIWKKSKQNILGYKIYLSDNGGKSFRLVKTINHKTLGNIQNVAYKLPNLKDGIYYRFRVTTYINDSKGRSLQSTPTTVAAYTIRPMYYKLTVRQGTTLESHNGKGAGWPIHRGQKITADKFSDGQYIIFRDNGGQYHINTSRVSADADYTKKTFNTAFGSGYTVWAAEKFVNDRKYGSSTPNLIWISTYTQHVYLFLKKDGKWKCVDNWECATGRADAPTPTGLNHLKTVHDRARNRNSIPWWSAFSSWNALHGRQSGWPVGDPASSGCVRNPNEKAERVYKMNNLMGTRVLVY